MKVVAAIFTIKVFVRICYVRPCIWEWATYPHYFGSINKLLQTKSFSHLFSHFRAFCVERNIWIFASYKEPKIVKVPDKDKWYAGSVISYQLKQPSEPHRKVTGIITDIFKPYSNRSTSTSKVYSIFPLKTVLKTDSWKSMYTFAKHCNKVISRENQFSMSLLIGHKCFFDIVPLN